MTSVREPPAAPEAPSPVSGPGAGTPPPGPRLPRWLQTVGFVVGGARFLEAVRRRYGDVVTLGTTFDERFVLVFSPELVRSVFQGSPTALHAGEANALLGPIVGRRSVLLLDEGQHLRHRRLMSPPFHGRAMLGWLATMREAADAQIDAWPVDEPFAIHASMQALTLLLAGHETTATGLAWTFDLLLHEPRVLARARERDDAYLDAVVKESLRIRPVIQGVGRVVRERPFELGGYTVPVGVEINPSIRTIHRRADLFVEPARFEPERFLSDDPPDTYTWIPFGGGTRRCLGASFATTEMRVVLSAVLERCELAAVDRRPARPQMRTITIGPKGGVRVRQTRTPLPAASAAS